jgi:Domain of unknown function (DUF6089)
LPSVAKNTINPKKESYLGLKKYFFILAINLLSTLYGFSQRIKKSSEIGLFLGGSYYIGDLNPNGHFSPFTKPAAGFLFRHNFNPRFAARVNALYGNIEAHDSYSKSAYQRQRNLSFKSQVIELSVQGEFNFQNYEIGKDKTMLSPYIFLGLGAFYFNPQTMDGTDLQPLRTEGEGLPGGSMKRKYHRIQVSVPMGIGVKAVFAKGIGIGFEWGMRKTFTDYLDDCSKKYYYPTVVANQKHVNSSAVYADPSIGTDPLYGNAGRMRGNPKTKDWYNFFGVVLTFKINQKLDLCPTAY